MSVNITYFVHGTTYDNQDHKATGWLPGELSPKGIEQVHAIKEKIYCKILILMNIWIVIYLI